MKKPEFRLGQSGHLVYFNKKANLRIEIKELEPLVVETSSYRPPTIIETANPVSDMLYAATYLNKQDNALARFLLDELVRMVC